ncbi:MAG: hypothetical protein H7Z37_14425 [Pyrinomonadaceae bacterium]|nr:hypothetical protein [Pyrinomonadaceae bacterium]
MILLHSKPPMILVIFCVSIISGCDALYRTGFVPIPNQPISGQIVIGKEWLELVPSQPLKPFGVGNGIVLKNVGYKKGIKAGDRIWSEDQTTLFLEDGRATKIEAFLFDDKGESYELRIGGVGGASNVVELSTTAVHIIKNGELIELKKAQPILDDRTYNKLKIRSEIPINCDGIDWVSSIGK